ncbi:hypothetical protein BDQ17DRAFT_1358926 [Cyathus striatus]|nr:hypothetical protein BDQ17DRAFT_1358926 [Cyathus striatus]
MHSTVGHASHSTSHSEEPQALFHLPTGPTATVGRTTQLASSPWPPYFFPPAYNGHLTRCSPSTYLFSH